MSIVCDLERTNQLNLLPDKDLVDLCPHIEPYQVTKNQIVLIQFPFDDLSSSKVRPAYCLTNQIGGYQHIIFALITSRIPENPLHTDIILRPENPDFMISGLRQSSAIRLDHLVTLRSSLIQRELGSLSLKNQTLIVDILSDILRS